MSSNWPDKPLIRIIRGNFGDKDVSGGLALMTPAGNYRTGKANVIANDRDDHIDEWEEVTPVPTAALKRLQNAFRGIDVIKSLEPPLLEVLACLPADKPTALDQAVTDDKRVQDCLEQINNRVDNWARGGEYGPGGFPKCTAEKDVAFLLAHIADLEAERKELRERVKELEVYEEREMIGDPAGLGGPSISDSLRDRNAARADAENARWELRQAESRIHELEMDIRSHKRTCPMFL